jgi:hypothetical protein
VDLQDYFTIVKIRMLPAMTPAGYATQEIYISDDLVSWSLVTTIRQYQKQSTWNEYEFSPELQNVRGFKIKTISSPSWVTWYEIEIFGY